MAIDLTISLTDAEQAKILEIASVIQPGATPQQVKTWAEKQAKKGLREIVNQVRNDHNRNAFDEAWPLEETEIPPQA